MPHLRLLSTVIFSLIYAIIGAVIVFSMTFLSLQLINMFATERLFNYQAALIISGVLALFGAVAMVAGYIRADQSSDPP